MSKSSKLKKHLAVATAALALSTIPATGLGAPITTPSSFKPSAETIAYNIGVSTGTFNALNYAASIMNLFSPMNFLGLSNTPNVPVTNQGAVSQSGSQVSDTNLVRDSLVSQLGGSDPLSGLKSINDHVVVVETSTKPKRTSTGNVKIDQAKTEQTEAAKKLLETAKSGDKDEIKKATEELQKKNDELKKVSEKEQNNTPNQEALEKSLKDAQEAAKKVEEARAKAELAARDYLNALKTGDPEIIAAYKERLQEANDAYLAARQNEEAQINNAINPYTIGGVYNNLTGTPEPGQQGGEQQDNSAESGGFPSLSELLRQYQEQHQQQQQSGETTIVTVGEPQESDALKRINDLIGKELIERETNARNKLVKAKTSEERQQAMKELDEIHRLETEKVQKAQAEQNILNLEMKIKEPNWEMDGPRLITEPVRSGEGTQGEPVKPGDYQEWLEQNKDTMSDDWKEQLKQKYNDLDKEFWKLEKDSFQAMIDVLDAKERGASQEELDRLEAKFEELSNEQSRILDERAAAEAKLEAAREAAMTPAEKVSKLEQKYNDLDKEFWKLQKDVHQANMDLLNAKERGASQEEIDRLQAKFDELSDEQRRIMDESSAARAELKAAREAAMSPAEKVSNLEQKNNDLDKEFWKLQKDVHQANMDLLNAKERGASQEEIDRLQAKFDELSDEQRRIMDESSAAKAELKAAREAANAAEPKQQTVEQPVQQQGGGETTMTEQKSAEQSAKDAAVKAAQENLDQIRKDAFDAYAALQKAQYDLSAAEDKAEQAANDYLLALKSGDKDTIAAFKEELQKANDALLEAKRNEEAAQQGLKEAGSNIARAQTELNNAQNNFNDSGAAGGETQQTTQQAVEQPPYRGLNLEMDGPDLEKAGPITEPMLSGEGTQGEPVKPGDYQEWLEQNKDILSSQQGEQRTSVVETGGQSGLNIGGGEHPVVETETTRPRTGASQQTAQEKIAALEQKYKELDQKWNELDKTKFEVSKQLDEAKARGASQEEIGRLQAEVDRLTEERDKLADPTDEAFLQLQAARAQQGEQQSQSQQGEQRTSVVETGGQSGLNIGGGETTMTEQKSAEQSAKDAAVKAAQENLDQIRKEGFDAYAALQKAQYDLSAAEDKAEQAANDYLLALKSGDKDTIAAFKEELQKANDALLEAKRNEEAAQQGLKEAGSNIARAQTELNNAQNNFNDSGAAGGETQQTTQQAVEQPPYRGLNLEMDGPITEHMLSGEGTQGEPVKPGDYQEWLEQNKDNLSSQQGEQRTSVETGGQSGLNIGGGETTMTEQKSAEQSAKDAAVKAAQENLDQIRKEGFDAYAALQKAQYDLSAAEDKAEQAANDYLLALKSGDKDTIAAFKEELQKANDALLEAKRNEEAAQQGLKEAGSNIARAQTELNNAQNNFNDSGAAGGETQQTTQQAVEQPTQQQTVEQSVQQQSGGETPITTQDPLKTKVTELEQKVNDLTKQYWASVKDRDQASRDYRDAQERGASQEELDRLKARYDELEKQKDSNLAEYRAAKAEQKVDDLRKQYWEGINDRDQAGRDYREAQERGASQEELDRLKARYDELEKQKENNIAEYRASKAEMQSAREAADAAEAELKAARAKATAAE